MEKTTTGGELNLAERTARDLEQAEGGDDGMRLTTLEDLLLTLGSELEGEQDQAGSTRP